jgi:hypothetical protein
MALPATPGTHTLVALVARNYSLFIIHAIVQPWALMTEQQQVPVALLIW